MSSATAELNRPDSPEPLNGGSLERLVRPLRPYYQDSHCTLYHGDCRDILASGELPKVNLVLTDPPYGVGIQYASFDDTKLSLRQLVGESIELIRRAADVVLLTPGNQNLWMYPEPDHVLAWMCPAGSGTGKWGFTCWHGVLAYGKDPYLALGLGSRPDAWMPKKPAKRMGIRVRSQSARGKSCWCVEA